MQTREPYLLVLVPFPLTPAAALAYLLGERLGLINENTVTRYHWRPKSPAAQTLEDPRILCLYQAQAVTALVAILGRNPQPMFKPWRKWCYWALSNPREGTSHANWSYLAAQLASANELPEERLGWLRRVVIPLLESGVDPHDDHLPWSESPPGLAPSVTLSADCRYQTLPVFNTGQKGKGKIVDWKQIEWQEGRVGMLVGQRLTLLVGGPSGSGKSTVVATLRDVMADTLQSLRSRAGWEQLELLTDWHTLDTATPVTGAVWDGQGQDRAELTAKKQPWTTELVAETVRHFATVTGGANLTVGDLPGRVTPEVTVPLACLGDVLIVVTDDWNAMQEWRGLAKLCGLIGVADAFSVHHRTIRSSMVTSYELRHHISGCVVGLDRTRRTWDPFLTHLCYALLFDILPEVIEQRRLAIEKAQEPFRRVRDSA